MRAFIERHFPTLARWLHMFGMDHILDTNSKIRLMIMGSCAISLFTGVAWIMDFVNFSCFEVTPWTTGGLHEHTCLYHLVGGLTMLFLFLQSLTALFYYDEDGEELRQKKERALVDLETQCMEALQRATGQAKRLCGLLSADLGDKVREHVNRMRTILEKVKNDPSVQQVDPHLYQRLVKTMATHLHRLRQPALNQFDRLIAISGPSSYLVSNLEKEKQQSMVQLLTGQTGLLRTETVVDDSALGMLKNFLPGNQSSPLLLRTTSIENRLRMPSEYDLRDELRDASSNEYTKFPDKVVLRPLRLVLRWFEKIQPKQPEKRPEGAVRIAFETPSHQLQNVMQHLQNSPLYRSMLLGVVISFVFAFIELNMMMTTLDHMSNGVCHGQSIVPCFFAVLRNALGLCAMVCYTISLCVVLWNIDRLDAVLQVAQELRELEDFKRHVDQLNAHDLQDEESSVSIIQSVHDQLTEQKVLVSGFFNRSWGTPVTIQDYQTLERDLAAVLAKPTTARKDGSAKLHPENDPKAYARVSHEDSIEEERTPLTIQKPPTREKEGRRRDALDVC